MSVNGDPFGFQIPGSTTGTTTASGTLTQAQINARQADLLKQQTALQTYQQGFLDQQDSYVQQLTTWIQARLNRPAPNLPDAGATGITTPGVSAGGGPASLRTDVSNPFNPSAASGLTIAAG